MKRVSASPFWRPLWQAYSVAPSVALCRVPELEYAARLDVRGKVLDHCCGDGQFAAMAWRGHQLVAGCDIDTRALERARARGTHTWLARCDAAQAVPFADDTFDLVFNNSGLEHIRDLDAALKHVARVLVPSGTFAFNVLNHRYFEWWSLGDELQTAYREWQPFFHALDLETWQHHLHQAGMQIVSVAGYFARDAARMLAQLDCAFSGVYLANRPSPLVKRYLRLPRLMQMYWRTRLAQLTWETRPDEGAGYFITATRIA